MGIAKVESVANIIPGIYEGVGCFALRLEASMYDEARYLVDFTRENIGVIAEQVNGACFNDVYESNTYSNSRVNMPGYNGDAHYGVTRGMGAGNLLTKFNWGMRFIRDEKVAEYLRRFAELDKLMLQRRRAIDAKLGLKQLPMWDEATVSRIMLYEVDKVRAVDNNNCGLGAHLDSNRGTSTIPFGNGHQILNPNGNFIDVEVSGPYTIETMGTQATQENPRIPAPLHRRRVPNYLFKSGTASISFFHGSAHRLPGAAKMARLTLENLHKSHPEYFS